MYQQPVYQAPVQPVFVQPVYQTPPPQYGWPEKSKIVVGVLGILLGTFGVHKFYLGRPLKGILYLLFFWTYIPGIIELIEGIIYLTQSEHNFQVKNQVRLPQKRYA